MLKQLKDDNVQGLKKMSGIKREIKEIVFVRKYVNSL